MSDQPAPAAGNSKMSPYAIVTAVVAGGLTLYFMSVYAGPWQWVAELQMKMMGGRFSDKLTFLLTFLGLWAVVSLVGLPLRRLFARNPAAAPPWAAPAAALPPLPTGTASHATVPPPGVPAPGGVVLQPKPAGGRLADLGLALLLLGGVFAVLGGRDYLRGSAGTTRADASVAAFAAGRPPESTWVRVTDGYPLLPAAVEFGRGSSPNAYVPIVAAVAGDDDDDAAAAPPATAPATRPATAPATRPAGGLRAFAQGRNVRLYAKVGRKLARVEHLEGLVTKNDLPGPVRTEMEAAGLLAAGADHWVIDLGKDPAKARSTGLMFLLIGGAAVVLGLLLNVGRLRRLAGR